MIWEHTIIWDETGDARFPWKAQVVGKTCTVRVNEFPADDFVYTLVIDGEGSSGFNEWPASWTRPSRVTTPQTDKPTDLIDEHEKAAFGAEAEWAKRAATIKASDTVN